MTALNYVKDYVQKNPYSRPGDPLIKVQAIVLHYTANPHANALDHANYFDGADGGGYRYAGAHIFVDKDEAREIIPLNEVAYHANERKAGPLLSSLKASTSYYRGGNANLLTIGIEMCIESDGSFHPETVKRTQAVIRKLQKQFPQLADTKNRVVRHYDVTGKYCPLPYVNSYAWSNFLHGIDNPPKPAPKPKPVVTPKPKPEVDEMDEKVIVVNSIVDLIAAEVLHKRTGDKFLFRDALAKHDGKVAKEIVLCGGSADGLSKYADKITNLSGKGREETFNNIFDYIKKQ